MMFGYVSKREHEAVVAERDTLRRTVADREERHRITEIDACNLATECERLKRELERARAKQPQRGDKGRFVGVGRRANDVNRAVDGWSGVKAEAARNGGPL